MEPQTAPLVNPPVETGAGRALSTLPLAGGGRAAHPRALAPIATYLHYDRWKEAWK